MPEDIANFSATIMSQRSFASAEHAMEKKRTRREKFLGEMDRVVPWARVISVIEPLYPTSGRVGRQPVGAERMLRMYCLQQWYGLADEALEDAQYDSQALRDFVGIDLSRESVPDATTLLKFRRLLLDNDLTRALFEEINAHLAEHKREEAQGPNWHVAMQPGQCKQRDTTHKWAQLLEQVEQLKASVRAKAEHPFHVIKNLFRHRKVRYKGLAKNEAQLFSLFGLANLVIAKRPLLSLHARGAS